jgi:hypothetical protein
MKNPFIPITLALLSLTVVNCGKKEQHDVHHHDAGMDSSHGGNETLHKEVMDVHNEVMPKMDDIFRLKESLKNKVASTPTMPDEKKKEIDGTIARLDSAGEGMMIWMRKFNPPPDSAGQEEAKKYLENEMVKVKKVRQDILDALEQGKSLQ